MPLTRPCLAQDPEIALMLRVQRDEPGAFAELERRLRGRIFARFFRWLRHRQEAEDLVQDVFLRVYRSRRTYQPTARFSTWLYHITQNVARNALRSRKRRPCQSLADAETGEQRAAQLRASTDAPSRGLERRELSGVVHAALAALGNRQRLALEMHQLEQRSYAEVAVALSMSPKAAKSLLYRARNQLRATLLERAEL